MALQHRQQVESFDETVKENEIDFVAHRGNSLEVTTHVEKVKKGTDETIKAIENAHNAAYEMKTATDEFKIKLSRKKDEMERLQIKLEDIKKQAELDNQRVLELKIEINKINIAIEKIKEIEQGLDQKYLEQSQNDLIDSLVKIVSNAEKAQSNLNVTKKIEEITFKKLEDVKMEFNKLKIYTLNKISETEKSIADVSTITQQVVRSYDEVANISKELFKSATNRSVGLKENGNYEI